MRTPEFNHSKHAAAAAAAENSWREKDATDRDKCSSRRDLVALKRAVLW